MRTPEEIERKLASIREAQDTHRDATAENLRAIYERLEAIEKAQLDIARLLRIAVQDAETRLEATRRSAEVNPADAELHEALAKPR